MASDLKGLVEYLDKRFSALDAGFVKMEARFSEMRTRIDELDAHFDVLQSAVDSYAKRADAYFQEMVVLAHRIERHEPWLHQIADQLGVKLEY